MAEAVSRPVMPLHVVSGQPYIARLLSVDIARGIGALLVVYTHLYSGWMVTRGESTPVTDAFSAAVTQPLGLGDTGLGIAGVVAFFVASGFIVTPMAIRSGRARFAVNRLFRIFPLLWFAVLLAALVIMLGMSPLISGDLGILGVGELLRNLTLVNYLIEPPRAVLGVTWTLLVEVVFYGMLVVLVPLLRRRPIVAVVAQLTLIGVALATHDAFGPTWRLMVVCLSFVTFPLIGQLMWAAWAGRVRLPVAVGLGVVSWLLFLSADLIGAGDYDDAYRAASVIGVALVALGLVLEERLQPRVGWTLLSDRVYSLYLLHGVVMFVILDVLHQHMPLWVAILGALAATAVAVECTYRLLERPSHQLGRALAHRLPGPRGRCLY